MSGQLTLLGLPPELLSYLFLHLSTPSFIQTILTCKQLYNLASHSRDAVLAHLDELPGIKLGLESLNILTPDLFLILRQRASSNLYGAEIHGNCTDVRLRSGTLNASASGLRDSADYFNISLALKESLIVRHCGFSGTLLKDHIPSPYADGTGTIIQILQGRLTVSVLYAWEPDESDGNIACPRSPSLRPAYSPLKDGKVDGIPPEQAEDDRGDAARVRERVEYHLVHYNAYNADRPDFFIVPAPQLEDMDLDYPRSHLVQPSVPVHLSVHHRRRCVVVWRVCIQSHNKPKDHISLVIFYETDRLPVGEAGVYTAIGMIPLHRRVKSTWADEDASHVWKDVRDYFQKFSARAAAFAGGGRRIKLYHAGGLTPYAIIPTDRTRLRENSSPEAHNWHESNKVRIQDHYFRTDTPFYANHRRADDYRSGSNNDPFSQCILAYLSLAWLTAEGDKSTEKSIDRLEHEDVLFIAQSHDRLEWDECSHEVPSLTNITTTPRPTLRIVARLRGFSEHWVPTNMTGLDTVSTSPKGTRIAIACWNKVLVYTLDPSILAEPWNVAPEETSDDDSNDGNDNDSDSESASTQAGSEVSNHADGNENVSTPSGSGPGGIHSNAQSSTATLSMVDAAEPEGAPGRLAIDDTAMIKATRYYKLTDDPAFGEIVELWPTVLQLPDNAVARKMMWGKPPKDTFPEVSTNTDPGSESELRASSDEDDAASSTSSSIADLDGDVDADASTSCATADQEGPIQEQRSARPASPACSGSRPPTRDTTVLSSEAPHSAPAEEQEQEQDDNQDQDDNHGQDDSQPPPPREDPRQSTKSKKKAKDKGKGKDERDKDKDKDKKPRRQRRPKRRSEDELFVLTDRGLQLWNLGARAKGQRARRWLYDV